MNPSRLFALCLCLIAFAVRAEPVPVETTPKLENLNSQIKTGTMDRRLIATFHTPHSSAQVLERRSAGVVLSVATEKLAADRQRFSCFA
ncbi:MAG: hypothetical protein ABIP85_12000 [Chthoniobacteraceae bacterium]